MPLYEYYCMTCDFTFEELSSLSESSKKKPCPECGKKAPRTVSAFAIASGGNGYHEGETVQTQQAPRDPRPLCMRYSGVPLSCHMDEPSLNRFIAHRQGRGAEYDDKTAKAAEIRKQRGIPEPVYAKPSHGHDHDHGHSHTRNPRRHAVTQGHDHGPTRDPGHAHDHGKKKAGATHSHGVHVHS
ncbi:MAG: FmdB family zinc ribbon protein [Candidatus Binatia bacterium]